jgi:hypothetical protein
MKPAADIALGPRSVPNPTRALIALLAVLVFGLALVSDMTFSGDLYLLLGTGRFISAHGFVWHDPFPTIAQGLPWHNQQWLAELIFFRVSRAVGLTGLALFYAVLLGLPLLGLLWRCRRKRPPLLLVGTLFYFVGLLPIIHPRAAGFTLLAFSLLVLLVLSDSNRSLVAIPALFLVWANLHGGFVAGLLLIAFVAMGLAVDRLRSLPGSASWRRIGLLALGGALALAATFGTPLGRDIWSYVASFRNPALSLGTHEWETAFQAAPPAAYVLAAAAFAAWLWVTVSRPRPLTPLLVSLGFVLLGAYSIRNLVLIPPAIFFQIARSTPDVEQPNSPSLRLALGVGAAAAAAVVAGVVVPGRTREPAYLRSGAAAYALRHPPKQGRILSRAGVGSYMLWRSPTTPVVLNGWLEHYTPAELRAAYGLLRGNPEALPYVRRWGIGAAVVGHIRAVRMLEARGFVAKYSDRNGIYLVREARRTR